MDTVRAWKDPVYRRSLGASAPSHPAGQPTVTVLSDAELVDISGAGTRHHGTTGCCSCNPAWSAAWGIWCNPPSGC
ncbi:mersacidin/lichenicidin family type 2 lantibiotic [Nonomuraea mesophila]|uniref:Mersacidin/lichenicidin family type 2 lantibiotic n=1 Tax=Nonomuraea mesophila TaxID=2530382 RepID=A0A4R5F1X6_9ACTN|nr:mersacidin/lichenicidin family type 2 lantibiotic [Nonomuraea mesophila]